MPQPIPDRRAEIEAFKTGINLAAYAASLGYEHDRRDSWAGSLVLRRQADDDKIIVTRDSDGHWIYASVRDPADNGSIIDFAQRRKRLNLGQVRRELRPWLGRPADLPREFEHLRRTPKDRAAVIARLAQTRPALRHPYLEQRRAIPPSLLSSTRFAGSVRIDARGNAVFPHRDEAGTCGAELKNKGYTGAPAGGTKGLWLSRCRQGDTTLALTETGIDALSLAVLHPDPADLTRYAATAGALNPGQPALIVAALHRLAEPRRLVIATDHDKGGNQLAHDWAALAEREGPPGLVIERALPPEPGQDWNEALRAQARARTRDRDRDGR
jgi:hypothetical protein